MTGAHSTVLGTVGTEAEADALVAADRAADPGAPIDRAGYGTEWEVSRPCTCPRAVDRPAGAGGKGGTTP